MSTQQASAPASLRAAGRRLDDNRHGQVTAVQESNGSWRLDAGPRGVRLEAGVMVALCRAVLYCARQGGAR